MDAERIINDGGFAVHFRDDSLLTAPYAEQYVGEWAHEPARLAAFFGLLATFDLLPHLASPQAIAIRTQRPPDSGLYETTEEGLAVVQIRGTMMKQQTSLGSGASTVMTKRALRVAAVDEGVRQIMLLIESPGGTVAGTRELATEVAAANQRKPVTAYIEDIGASAAYWVASQAGKVFANEMAWVGSIGTYGVIWDTSGAAAMEGVKVHVIRAGAFKGAGEPGTEVTAATLAYHQKLVDGANAYFLEGVSAGRKKPLATVQEWADGRVHPARTAAQMGMIDGVQSLDETINQIHQQLRRKPGMQPATYQQIKAECVGADAEFIVAELDAGATVEQARKDWMTEQSLRLEEAKKGAAAKAKAETKAPGVQPLPEGANDAAAGGSGEDFWAAVKEREKAGMPRARAIAATVKEDHARHAAMLAEHNQAHQAKRRRAS